MGLNNKYKCIIDIITLQIINSKYVSALLIYINIRRNLFQSVQEIILNSKSRSKFKW